MKRSGGLLDRSEIKIHHARTTGLTILVKGQNQLPVQRVLTDTMSVVVDQIQVVVRRDPDSVGSFELSFAP